MFGFWKNKALEKTLEKMKNMLINFVHDSEEDLLDYGIHIEHFSFEVPKELKKLFFCSSRLNSFMYFYYDFIVPISSKEVFNFTSIFYSKNYSYKPRKNPSEFSFIKDFEEEKIEQPKLYSSFRFDVYTGNSFLDQKRILKIFPTAKIFMEMDKVGLITCDLPFEIKYKVYYLWAWLLAPWVLYLAHDGPHEGNKKRNH